MFPGFLIVFLGSDRNPWTADGPNARSLPAEDNTDKKESTAKFRERSEPSISVSERYKSNTRSSADYFERHLYECAVQSK